MQLKSNVCGWTENFYYDLFEGYIKPEEILAFQSDIDMVRNAINVIKLFKQTCEENVIDLR